MAIERIHHAISIKHCENSKDGKCVECRTEPPNKRNRQRPTQKVGNDNLSESLRFRQDAGASCFNASAISKGLSFPTRRSIALRSFCSRGSTNVSDEPLLPALAVRPTRCT